jgi:hypothetical protein
MADLTIEQVRQQYPQYGDLSDDQLAQALHKKYYSDMPFDTFAGKIGYSTTPAPKDYDPTPKAGVPQGFHEIRTNGAPYIVHDTTIEDAIKALSDLPGVGAAERIGQGATRLAGKAASGIAGIFGGPDTVQKVQSAVNNATELPPSNDPLVTAVGAVGNAASSAAAPVDRAVGNLPPAARTAIEGAEEAAPDIASVLGFRAVAPTEAATTSIARSPAEVAQAAGYTGLRTKADLTAPGNQAITDALISKDAGIVPGQTPSIASLENGRNVGPGRVYRDTENSIPANLTQDDKLRHDLGNLPNQVSQLPRSPDVDALQTSMLAKPDFTRDELFANIREARERAKAHWKSDDPDKDALGDAYHSLANAYEDFAGRQPGVDLPAWLQARTQMAKNYQAQAALQGPQGSEHFNAQTYGKIAARNPGLLTGNSAIVGHVANGLPANAPAGMADILPEAAGVTAGGAATEAVGHALGVPGGGAVGAIAGHYAAAPFIRAKLQELLRRGDPELAGQTDSNPALSYFFNQGRMPPGWNRSPAVQQIAGLLPSPSMVNTGGGATTQNTLESLGLTPDVRAAGAQHPATARLGALREQLSQPPERPAEPIDFQGPQKWGDFSIAPPGAPQSLPGAGGIPLENLLEQGGNQRKPVAGIDPRVRIAPQSPKGPNVRTPSGAPELTDKFPIGPSDAQIAFRNQQAAARLRKVAGDLSMQGPGGSTGTPLDRLRDALARHERGYAGGGDVPRGSSSPGSPGVGGAVQDALSALRDYFITRPRRELQAERDQFDNSVIDNPPPSPQGAPTGYADGGPAPDTPVHPKQPLADALARLAAVPSAGSNPAAQAAYLARARTQVGDPMASLMRARAILNAAQAAPSTPPAATQGGG